MRDLNKIDFESSMEYYMLINWLMISVETFTQYPRENGKITSQKLGMI